MTYKFISRRSKKKEILESSDESQLLVAIGAKAVSELKQGLICGHVSRHFSVWTV